MQSRRDFANAYRRLAEQGACDPWGGLESRRVLDEWVALGCPEEIDDFITERANSGRCGGDGRWGRRLAEMN
jgi:hypothetical protein